MNLINHPNNFNFISLCYSYIVYKFIKHKILSILPQIVESGIYEDGDDWAQAEYYQTGWTTTGNVFGFMFDFLECQRIACDEYN